MPASLELPHPPQRTFKPRRRGLSPSRVAAYERSMARWSLAVGGPPLSFDEVFASDGDVVLDIGFGGGEALIEMAELRPLEHVIGVDVHTPGVAAVLEAIEARGMRNVRVVEGDVIELFDRIPPASLSAVRIFFPDPWPKRRQRGRRLVRPDVMSRMVPLVRALGTIHIVTDCSNYAVQIAHVCGDHAGLVGGVVDRPYWRPTTRFEQRGIDEGRAAVDFVYIPSVSSASDSSSA